MTADVGRFVFRVCLSLRWEYDKSETGLNRDLNPGPPAPEAGIIPLDHWANIELGWDKSLLRLEQIVRLSSNNM